MGHFAKVENGIVTKVIVADPWANQRDLKKIYDIQLDNISNKNQVDSLIVGVGHNEFRSLTAEQLKSLCRGDNPVIADVKSIYNIKDL